MKKIKTEQFIETLRTSIERSDACMARFYASLSSSQKTEFIKASVLGESYLIDQLNTSNNTAVKDEDSLCGF